MKQKSIWALMAVVACTAGCSDNNAGAPGRCDGDGDCPGVEFCIGGVCTAVVCTRDEDCERGSLCLGDGTCGAAECRINADCCSPNDPSCGRTCYQNKCLCGECVDGQTEECFRGCHRGQKVCSDTCWSVCDAEQVLAEEVCGDVVDNDCNGQVDDGCSCTVGTERACDSPCGPGTQTCQADGTWQECDNDCCQQGQSGQKPCGNCGFYEGVCSPEGRWQWSETCQGEGVCTPEDVDTDSDGCSKCGEKERTCQADCTWGEWGECAGAGECEPDVTLEASCGTCGVWELTCNAECQWVEPDACDESASCDPGTDTRPCGKCGIQTRTCDGCTWTEWSDCSDEVVDGCVPGSEYTDACGNCGECTRVCGNDCSWQSCDTCQRQGQCRPPSAHRDAETQTEDCGPGTTVGECENGSKTRQCTPACTWGSWSDCDGAVYAEDEYTWELCGNGLDEDCNGYDLVLEDDHEPNDSCATCKWLGIEPDTTVYGTMDSAGDGDDYFCFQGIDQAEVFHTEEITVSATGMCCDMDVDIYLYDGLTACEASETSPSADALEFSENYGSDDEALTWEEGTGTDTGYYYVRVRNYGITDCFLEYTLRVKGLH